MNKLALIATVRFFSSIPLPSHWQDDWQQAMRYLPLLGLFQGLLLCAAAFFLQTLSPAIAGFLLLLLWFSMTGFLHLDGLADMADALGAKHADASRLWQVMKEPQLGAFAVVVLLLYVLGMFVAVQELFVQGEVWVFLYLPFCARLAAVYFLASLKTPTSGLAHAMQAHLPERSTLYVAAFLLALIFIVSQAELLFLFLFVILWRNFLYKKFGMVNGDVLGAGILLMELCGLWLSVLAA